LAKRRYEPDEIDDLYDGIPDWVKNIGVAYKLNGIILSGPGEDYHLFFDPASPAGRWENCPTLEEWGHVLQQSDDPRYLVNDRKPWLRKAQMVVSGDVQQKIFARDNFCCAFCGRVMGDVTLSVDHFVPLDKGLHHVTNGFGHATIGLSCLE